MANQTILEQVRTPLAAALSSVAGNVYAFVPESVVYTFSEWPLPLTPPL